MRPVLKLLHLVIALSSSAVFATLATQAQAVGRLADLTIHDRTEGRTLPIHWHQGQAWVEGKPGNEYQVNVRNATASDMLTVVSVDGVNVITGETASPDQTGYIVDPWRHFGIKGWRKDTRRTAAFYFTSLADAYAARTGRPDHVGVIGIAVFRRKVEPVTLVQERKRPGSGNTGADRGRFNSDLERSQAEPMPPTAPAPVTQAVPETSTQGAGASAALGGTQAPRDASAGIASGEKRAERSRLGTGHGRSEYSRVTLVDFERATAQPEETLTIRYDSHANLVARGVIVARVPERSPNPFPNAPQRFVPDPPRD